MSTTDRALPENTLLVLLGASAYPNWPSLEANQRFANSAEAVVEYFLDKHGGFKLPYKNLLNLFDSEKAPNEQSLAIGTFIKERSRGEDPSQKKVSDLIVYFIGHGGFEGVSDYYLTLRTSDEASPGISSLRARDIAKRLERDAHKIRCTLILDSCFSGAAPYSFMSSSLQNMTKQLDASLRAIPSRGITLLCSSSKDDPSIAPNKETLTLFSGSLLRNLKSGLEGRQPYLTLRELHSLICTDIRSNFSEYGVLPEIHSPNQRQGDIATEIDLFPNAGFVAVEPSQARVSDHVAQVNTLIEKVEPSLEASPVVPVDSPVIPEHPVPEPTPSEPTPPESTVTPAPEPTPPESTVTPAPEPVSNLQPTLTPDPAPTPDPKPTPGPTPTDSPGPTVELTTPSPDPIPPPTPPARIKPPSPMAIIAFIVIVLHFCGVINLDTILKDSVNGIYDFVAGIFQKKPPESAVTRSLRERLGDKLGTGSSGISGSGSSSGVFSTTGGTSTLFLKKRKTLKEQIDEMTVPSGSGSTSTTTGSTGTTTGTTGTGGYKYFVGP